MQREKIDSLTSLRFLAAAMVVIFHSRQRYWGFGIPDRFVLSQAVSFFFVLSGFILSYTHRGTTTWKEVRDFYVNRFARIWPLHVFCAVAVLLIIIHEGHSARILDIFLNATLLHAWSVDPITYFSLNGVSWSLSVEAFFYAVFPLLIFNVERSWKRNLVVVGVICALVIALSGLFSDQVMVWAVYIFPVGRLWEFMLGIAAFQVFRMVAPRKTSVSHAAGTLYEAAILGICAWLIWESHPRSLATLPFSVPRTLAVYLTTSGACLGFTVLIVVFAVQRGFISRMLNSRPLVYLGKISFALYLLHQVVFRLALEHLDVTGNLPLWVQTAIYWCAALLASAAAYHLIEEPARKLIATRFSPRPSKTHVAGGVSN